MKDVLELIRKRVKTGQPFHYDELRALPEEAVAGLLSVHREARARRKKLSVNGDVGPLPGELSPQEEAAAGAALTDMYAETLRAEDRRQSDFAKLPLAQQRLRTSMSLRELRENTILAERDAMEERHRKAFAEMETEAAADLASLGEGE